MDEEPLKPVPIEAGGEPLRPVPVRVEDAPGHAPVVAPEPVVASEPAVENASLPQPVAVDEDVDAGEADVREKAAAAPPAPRDPNIPHADDTATDCKVRAFQRARRREREQEEAAEAEARARAAEAQTCAAEEAQARATAEAAAFQPAPVPAEQPQEAPALPSFEPDEIFYGEDVDAMLDDDFALDGDGDDALPPLEQTITVAFEAPDALQYEFAPAPEPVPESAGDAEAMPAEVFHPLDAPAAPDVPAPAAPASGAAFTVELLEPETPAVPEPGEPSAPSAEEEALAWEKFESNRRKAQGFRDRGKNLVAAGLFARAADLAPERQQWREMLFEELGCYVRADKMDEARELARILLAQGTLTRANRIKLNAIISKK